MRSFKSLLVLALMLGSLLVSSPVIPIPKVQATTTNILRNGSWEDGLAWWNDTGGNPGVIDTVNIHSGSGLQSYNCYYSQIVEQSNIFTTNQVYIDNVTSWTVWLKVGSGTGMCIIEVETVDGQGGYHTLSTQFEGGSQTWTQVNLYNLILNGGNGFRILYVMIVKMDDDFTNYWFDGMDMEITVPAPPPVLPYNYSIWLRRFENGTVEPSSYVADIRLLNGTEILRTISADNTTLSSSSLIYSFEFPYNNTASGTLFLPGSFIYPIIPQDVSDVYLFTIRDLTGYLNGKTCVLEAYRTIGGHTVVLSSMSFVNTVNGIPLRLSRNRIVELKLWTASMSNRYSFGYFMPTGNPLDHELIFNYNGFDNTLQYVNSWISASASRNITRIDVTYENRLIGYSFNATATLYRRNGSPVQALTSYLDAYTFTFTGLNSTTDYFVNLKMFHSHWPGQAIDKTWIFEGAKSYQVPGAYLEDMGWTFGGVSNVIPAFLLIVIAGVFSFASAPLGLLLTVIFAGIFNATGFMPIPVALLSLAFSLVIIFIISRRSQQVG